MQIDFVIISSSFVLAVIYYVITSPHVISNLSIPHYNYYIFNNLHTIRITAEIIFNTVHMQLMRSVQLRSAWTNVERERSYACTRIICYVHVQEFKDARTRVFLQNL